MKTVKQDTVSDCAISCVSMLTGFDKDFLYSTYKWDEIDGYRFWEVKRVIMVFLDLDYRYGSIFHVPKLDSEVEILQIEYDLSQTPALLTVETDLDIVDDVCHFVVWDNEKRMVRDPSIGKGELEPIEDYKILEWANVEKFVRLNNGQS